MPEPKSPFKRARRAFDRTVLKRVCEMHETEFADFYKMETTFVPAPKNYGFYQEAADYPLFYSFLDRGADILAVAHLDTVVDHEQRTAYFIDTKAGPIVHSGALDDRLGAYTILELLPKLGVNVDVLLTTGEESGQSTADQFVTDKDYLWIIEFDRGGTDVVMYQYEDADTRQLVRDCGARVGQGSFSDVAYLEHLEVKGFNWGVGYQDYHSVRGHAYLEDYWMMIAQFLKFHDVNADEYLPHEIERRTIRSTLWEGMDHDGPMKCWDCGDMLLLTEEHDGVCAECKAAWEKAEARRAGDVTVDDDVVDVEDIDDLISEDWNVVNARLYEIRELTAGGEG